MQEFKYLIQVSAGDQRKNFGHQVKLFGYEFLASRYPMVAISEDNASSLTAPFFVVFCRTRKIPEQYYSNSYPWLYSEILELQHQFVHINVNVSPVGDQFLRCSHQHSNFSWIIGDHWVIISSLEMHFHRKMMLCVILGN